MSVPKASTVANKFVKEYYNKLKNSPETMKLFYNEKVSQAAIWPSRRWPAMLGSHCHRPRICSSAHRS